MKRLQRLLVNSAAALLIFGGTGVLIAATASETGMAISLYGLVFGVASRSLSASRRNCARAFSHKDASGLRSKSLGEDRGASLTNDAGG